jgi:hypothetical protein
MKSCRSRSCVSRRYVQFSVFRHVKLGRLSRHGRITTSFLSHALFRNVVPDLLGSLSVVASPDLSGRGNQGG